LRTYLKKISRTNFLTKEEEARLAKLARKGDTKARNKLVESNLLFVVKMARENMNQGLPLSDLIQEGNLGLIHAIKKFDERLGFRLTTYASWWIRLSIKRALIQKSRPIRIPANKLEWLRKIKAYRHAFEREHGRLATIEETAKVMNLPKAKIESILQLDSHFSSFEMASSEDGLSFEQTICDNDVPPPDVHIQKEEMKNHLERAMQVLSQKERSVLELRFGLSDESESASLREVGKRMGLSAEGVRRIENQALAKLRRPTVRSHVEGLV